MQLYIATTFCTLRKNSLVEFMPTETPGEWCDIEKNGILLHIKSCLTSSGAAEHLFLCMKTLEFCFYATGSMLDLGNKLRCPLFKKV